MLRGEATLPVANAHQFVRRAQINPPLDDGRRREDRRAQVVAGDDLERVCRADDVGDASLRWEIEQIAGDDRRCGKAVVDALQIEKLAGDRVEATEDAGVVGGVESSLDVGGRWHVW